MSFKVLGGALMVLTMAGAGCTGSEPTPGPGISWELAQERARRLTDLRYDLAFGIPSDLGQPIHATATVRFRLDDPSLPLALDFDQPDNHLLGVVVNGTPLEGRIESGHISLPSSALRAEENTVRIEFLAGDGPLNRTTGFLYTLFVPDRAHEAFPCFDQPNLKARYTLKLTTPGQWVAVSNSPVKKRSREGDSTHWEFAQTKPLSTYHFAFAAGEFQTETSREGGRSLTMFHRETDPDKIAENRDAIFELHRRALDWLEEYTGIPYPYDKFEFVLIPSFQYGGMEHPGSILYRAEGLLLDETATQNQLLGRASLIAHETSHMWFGDLVTMNWFDDVWTKEVFANFMAAKIVNPSFPGLNHDLRFLMAHYPAAYEIDRSAGTHPIRQQLDNLDEAGSLYGAIIYQKAPIVMRQLELLLGGEPFRQGLRTYLDRYRYGNATWSDLVGILDQLSDDNLKDWSHVWVEEAGRPQIQVALDLDSMGRIGAVRVLQSDPSGQGRLWSQRLEAAVGGRDDILRVPLRLTGPAAVLPDMAGRRKPDFVLANGRGYGYADFQLDANSQAFLLKHLSEIDDPLLRGVAWLSLWEALLGGRVGPAGFLETALESLPRETEELNIETILGFASETYWRFLDEEARTRFASRLEGLCWNQMSQASAKTLKATYLKAFRSIFLTHEATQKLRALWDRELAVDGINLSEEDDLRIAAALAIRLPEEADILLAREMERIANPDRKARFSFVLPALSANADVRDSFFESLKDLANRRREPWVLEGLSYLHHPLRAGASEKYIQPSLEMLEEIHRTGDIFFPKRWLDATLGGCRSESAAAVVRSYLAEHPDLPDRLRGKVLQSADLLFRASRSQTHSD